MIELKDDLISLEGLVPQMVLATVVVDQVLAELAPSRRAVITAGADRFHSLEAAHYRGAGLDFRTKGMSESETSAVAAVAQTRLGRHFKVQVEATHLHVEYTPQRSKLVDAWKAMREAHPELWAEMDGLYNPA